MALEQMSDFFEARVEDYEKHMLEEVEGCREGYEKMAELLPYGVKTLLDLGCGTGLELDAIFKRYPAIEVTGIDLTQAMLDKLKDKHPDKKLTLIQGSYFDQDYGTAQFDTAVSFQTMHHFSHADKIILYQKIFRTLKEGGMYLECDYMVTDQKEEDLYYAENARIRREQGIINGEFYHYDTPCTIKNQTAMLLKSGFYSVSQAWQKDNTTLLIAYK